MSSFKAEIVWMNPNALTPYQNNAKKHSVKQLDKIAAQIHSVGFTQPIVVDKDHVIIAGHGRREAALRLNMDSVPVIVAAHLDEFQVKAARIADNRVAEDGEIDNDILKFELGSLQLRDFDLKLTGFELGQLEGLLDEPKEPSTRKESKAKEKSIVDDSRTANAEPEKEQWIVVVECSGEDEMRGVFEELSGRGLKCKMIT